jgi:hypothetical protein
MRNIKIVFVALFIAVAFVGCIGDHAVGNGRDTEQNSYHVTVDNGKSDTVDIIRHTGDSASSDYSSTGGAQLIKPDTSKRK